ncbi:hypothetical protein [Megamonas hypermegale]|uniref:hypothetical protein n=1 Tax=Megamonas hypermegale TaxID=158847 RepID=UPI00195E617A|nr:hypothetical protein [Megamonas hypermegale]
MKKLACVVLSFVFWNIYIPIIRLIYNVFLKIKQRFYPDLEHVIADIVWSDLTLCEEDIAIAYKKLVKAFCREYDVKTPKLIFRQIDPNNMLIGLFEYKPYTISINVEALILNSMNETSGLIARNTMVFVLLHELRHCWQYKYHKEDILYWCETHNHLYNIFYEECPIEIDANEFAKSAGLHDSGDIFNKLPLSLYEDFDKAVGLKEEAEASRKIKKAVAVALNRIYLE